MALKQRDINEINALIKDQCTEASEISKHLLRAPEAACILEVLTVLAGCTYDPSLRSGAADEKFDYLKSPDSFKASLYQVINEMRDAFKTGHNCVTKMQLNLKDMPTSMNDILEALDNLDDSESKDAIDHALKNIKTAADKCAAASKEATNGATHALEVIRELLRAAKATQGRKENRDKEVKVDQQDLERIKKQREAVLKKLEEEEEEQKKIVKEDRQDFKDKMGQSSSISGRLASMVVDGLCSVVENTTAPIKAIPSHIKEEAAGAIIDMKNAVSSCEYLKKDDIMAKAMEFTLFNLVKRITLEVEPIPKAIKTHSNSLEEMLEYKFSSDTGRMLRKIAKSLYHAFSVDPFDDELIQETIDRAKVIVEMVKNIRTSIDAEEDRKLQREANKSQERQSLMQHQQKDTEIACSIMKESREYAEKLRKERAEADEKLNETINALASLKLEGVDLKDVLKYLQEGVEQLTEFQAAWEYVTQFFEGVQMIVDGPLVTKLNSFAELVDNNKDKEKVGALIRKMMCREAMKACVVGNVLYNTATLYKEISSKYVLPSCEQSLKNMALTQEEAKILQRSISSNFNEIKDAVKDAIENHSGRLPKAVEESLKIGGFQLAIEEAKE